MHRGGIRHVLCPYRILRFSPLSPPSFSFYTSAQAFLVAFQKTKKTNIMCFLLPKNQKYRNPMNFICKIHLEMSTKTSRIFANMSPLELIQNVLKSYESWLSNAVRISSNGHLLAEICAIIVD